MQDQPLTTEDLRLLNALQIRPRASWSSLARVIGSDPVTLGRRWDRLRTRGIAWIAVYGSGSAAGVTAMLEIECAPSHTLRIADEIADDPEVLTVDLTTGNRDLLVTVICSDHDQLSRYVLERMGTLSEIRGMRTQIVSAAVSDARNWRLRALEPAEVSALEAEPTPTVRPGAKVPAEIEARLFAELTREPRITIAALADALGVTKARAGAFVATAIASGRVVLRTEVARPYSGWPIYAWYFLSVEARDREATAGQLAKLREARLVASTIGTYDIALAVWLRSMDDVQRLEAYLAEHFPRVGVADRSIVLRTPTHLRRRVDLSGRSPE
ncbi:Lrp/AsnC family transcriptional regulator [Microbacteriaceae bacterium VKM Ac-2855]|nr:Lrp/AsnC family transcriptional regulator [Microbacteriaceae bacterium VKM Ac-2855]